MRVAVNAEQLLYRSPGGIGRYTAQLLTVLPCRQPDWVVQPFVAWHPRPVVDAVIGRLDRPPDAPPAVRLPLPRALLFEAWVGLGRGPAPGRGQVELVHAPSVAVPPRTGVPLVVTVHDAAPELFPEAFPPRGRHFHRLGLRAAARRADLVLAVSEAAADEIVAHSPVPAERIRVVPNGVEAVHVDPATRDRVLGRWGLADRRAGGRPYVLWVGSLEPRKGVGTLVAAMAELRRRGGVGADADLVLAGYPGWLGDDLVAAADRATLGDRLHQIGTVDETELWALYAGATVGAVPSRHEGFGLPLVEAMSVATPVVASDIAALREVAGGAALLVDPTDVSGWADAIGFLLADPDARERAGSAGVERSRILSLDAFASGVARAYAEVLGR